MHTLATRVYEKGPQNLADAIKEVEKLQAAQQLTGTLLPSSSVNIMSSDDDKCFQCQESGHMAHHCPCIKCFDCEEYGHVAEIAPTKSHHQAHQQGTEIPVLMQDTVIDPHPTIPIEIGIITMIIETDIGLAGQDPIPTVIDTGVTVEVTNKGVNPGHITNPHTTAHHATKIQVDITTDKTLHTENPHHTEVFPGIAVDPDHMHHTNTTAKHHQNCLTALTRQPEKTRTENINKSPLMTHHPNTTALMNNPVNLTRI